MAINKRGLFGINIVLILAFFILGIFVGGYVVLKSQGFFKEITSFVTEGSETISDVNDALNSDTNGDIVVENFTGDTEGLNVTVDFNEINSSFNESG